MDSEHEFLRQVVSDIFERDPTSETTLAAKLFLKTVLSKVNGNETTFYTGEGQFTVYADPGRTTGAHDLVDYIMFEGIPKSVENAPEFFEAEEIDIEIHSLFSPEEIQSDENLYQLCGWHIIQSPAVLQSDGTRIPTAEVKGLLDLVKSTDNLDERVEKLSGLKPHIDSALQRKTRKDQETAIFQRLTTYL
jgi:hypothetical protein